MDRTESQARAAKNEEREGLSLLDLQIARHERHDKNQSQLARMVGWASGLFWSKDTQSLGEMKELRSEIVKHQRQGNADKVKELESGVSAIVKKDREAVGWRDEISHYGTGLVKTGSLFFAGGGGRIAAATFYGLDGARRGDELPTQFLDGGLGALKGGLMHKFMSSMGAGTVGVAGKGVLLGMTSRGLETALDRRTYTGADGTGFNAVEGLSKVGSYVIDPTAWLADGATFLVAHGMVKGGNRLTGGMLERSRTLQTMATGSSFGMTTGALNEIDRQHRAGEELSLNNVGKIAARSLVQGGFDTLAALPGGVHGDPVARNAARGFLRDALGLKRSGDGINPVSNALASVISDSAALSAGRAEVNKPGTVQPESAGQKGAEKVRPSAKVLSDQTLADGNRVIRKADGTTVTISKDGQTVVEKDGIKITYREGHRPLVEGDPAKIAARRRQFEHERPLNASSTSGEKIAKEVSNLGHTPFKMADGVTYASVEAFYVCTRITDPVKRAEVAKLHGPEAKAAGKPYRTATHGTYNGRTFELGSPEHHAVIKEALEAKFAQNSELADAFMRTHPRPIVHNTFRPESKTTKYPGAVFTQQLSEIRQSLVDRAGYTPPSASADSTAPNAGRILSGDSGKGMGERGKNYSGGDGGTTDGVTASARRGELSPLSDIFRAVEDAGARERHDFDLYAKAFEGTAFKGSEFLGAGANYARVRLADGNVMKVTLGEITAEMGQRPFDLPILERGVLTGGRLPVHYFVQPEAFPVLADNYRGFRSDVQSRGYIFSDPGLQQVGYYNGQVYLLDPFAVERGR